MQKQYYILSNTLQEENVLQNAFGFLLLSEAIFSFFIRPNTSLELASAAGDVIVVRSSCSSEN